MRSLVVLVGIQFTRLLLIPVMVNFLQITIQIQIDEIKWHKYVNTSAMTKKYCHNDESFLQFKNERIPIKKISYFFCM